MKFITIPASVVFVLAAVAASLLILAGCLRYGGPTGVIRRVQAEWAAHQPRPEFAPTPLSLPPGAATAILTSTQPITGAMAAQAIAAITVTAEISAAAAPTTTQQIVASSPSATALPLHQTAAPAVELTGFNHQWQTWNNCGPATLAMNLSYFGSPLNQADIGSRVAQI
ncbi:MAG: hypothetical protein R3A44_34025 [Caldilineaceae bacterium]